MATRRLDPFTESTQPRRLRSADWIAIGSIIAILLATLSPWLGIAPMQIPAAWCLRCGAGWLIDAVSNVLLFLPLGGALEIGRAHV